MVSGVVRKPRAWISCSGGMVNVLECTVSLVRGAQASTFEAVMALDEASNPGAAYWSDTAPIPASVVGTNGDGGTTTLITGDIIEVDVDFTQRIVRVHGVDKTHDFISTRNDQKYPNMTTEQVVQQIAANHGCAVNSDGASDQAGRTYDGQEYAYNTDVENDWDAVQACAQQDGKIAYLDAKNSILNYVNPGDMPNAGNYAVEYVPPTPESYEQGTVVHLQCKRDIQIAEGVQGEGASFDSRLKQAHTAATGSQ